MATQHGAFGEFCPDKEDWISYTERLEQYFQANDVDAAEKQRAILLSVCGASTYQLIRDLVAPERPSTKTFQEVVQLVKEHHQPPPSFIVQRYNFNMRSQKEGETISAFMASLRRLSEHCKYEAILDDMLRDRLVCGVRDRRIQQRLLSETDLTLQKAMELALAAEAATRNSQELQASKTQNTEALHKVQHSKTSQKESKSKTFGPCYRCGGNHAQRDCRFREAECRECKKKGHIARVCRSKTKSKSTRSTHRVSQEQSESEGTEDEILLLHCTRTNTTEPITVTVKANQADLEMEVDTGASASIISEATYKKLWRGRLPPLKKTNVKLRTYSGEIIKVLGTTTIEVVYESQKEELPLLVVVGNGPSLLGKDWMKKIRLNWNQLVHKVEEEEQTPWTRLHIYYAGPFIGKMFLVIVDAYSKWLEVMPVSSANSTQTVTALRQVFSTHGIPEVIVSDNGTPFTSFEFKTFTKSNGIRHLTSAPYHPSTNGLAERAVQTFKRAMKKSGSGELSTKLARFLFHYRTTPHSTTGQTPAELLMGRSLRTCLDLLRPNIRAKVENKQLSQKSSHDVRVKERSFFPQDKVYVREAGTNSPWTPGVIVSKQGNLTYGVRLEDERLVRRHVDHVQSRSSSSNELQQTEEEMPDEIDIPSSPAQPEESQNQKEPAQPEDSQEEEQLQAQEPLRRSTRGHRKPQRYGYSIPITDEPSI